MSDSPDERLARQLSQLQELPQNWDGHGAGPIERHTCIRVRRLLNEILTPNTPEPHLTPMSSGGVLIEWHQNGIDLEIDVPPEPSEPVYSSFENNGEESEWLDDTLQMTRAARTLQQK